MTRPTILAVLAVAALAPALTLAGAPRMGDLGSSPRGWSAVAGADTPGVIAMAASLPASTADDPAAPFCDANPVVAQTLTHDFGESLVDDSQIAATGTQLWGSEVMGTWTLVLARNDATSCIVASGIGYDAGTNPRVYYTRAGLAV